MKTVVISGASAGIGLACAKHFSHVGYQVISGARRTDKLEGLSYALDVCSTDSVDEFAKFVFKHCKSPDVVINNAGMAAGVDPIVSVKENDWQQMLDTNVSGVLRFTKAFLPAMIEQKKGHVINIGSIAGHHAYAGGGVYAATKHAVKAINDCLRLELIGTPLRVSTISPGMVETEFSEVRLKDKQKAVEVYKGLTPLNADDIAEAVLFMAQRPPHVNIDDIIIMPTAQYKVFKVHREE